jgi:hypothetical protein
MPLPTLYRSIFKMTTFCFGIFIVNYAMDEKIAPFF